jgi:diaminohydroxyphosphoribosylaminopyrimidine deaminase/5-amino-6-(5-phosphoribosylamino)uracil reductase
MMHDFFMQAALKQAWLGRGITAPNPAVGAVAVLDGNIIAQAVTAPNPGVSHAEQLLLKTLPDNCSNMTLYVTLEPCNHWGKTPPCTEGIILKRFKQVVYAYRDPNPLVSENNTPDLLAKQGIDVVHYPMPEVDAFYASYAFWLKTKRPWVTVKMAQSFDGKIAGKNSERVYLSNSACAKATHDARLHTDVILTTARTIRQDDPLLNVRIGKKIMSKPVAVLDNQKQLPATAQIHQTAKKLHIYTDMDLLDILLDLGRIGYHDVWVEAGSQLFNALHQNKLVQRTILYLVPNILGEEALSLYHDQSKNILSGAKRITWHGLDDNLQAVLDWD